MGHLARAAGLCAALALLAGCGGSLADTDAPRPVQEQPQSSEFCEAVTANSDAVRPLGTAITRGTGPGQELSDLIAEVRRTNDRLVATAPGEIRSEVDRTIAGSTVQLDALETGGSDAAQAPEVRAAVEDPEFTAAGERIREFVQANC